MIPSLSGSYIDETYGRLVQVSGSEFADGFGTTITFGQTPTGSLLTTASVSTNTITFTKGNGDQFAITVDTGSATNIDLSGYTTTGSFNQFTASTNQSIQAINSVTSSFVPNTQTGSFAITDSNTFRNNQIISGALSVTNGVTASLQGTASWSTSTTQVRLSDQQTSDGNYYIPYVTNTNLDSLKTDSTGLTYNPLNNTLTTTASFALTASSANSLTIRNNLIVSGNVTMGDTTTDSITLNAATMSLGSGTGILNIDSNTLYVDGNTNRIGISTTNPSYALDISGSLRLSGNNPAGTVPNILIRNSTTDSSSGLMGQIVLTNSAGTIRNDITFIKNNLTSIHNIVFGLESGNNNVIIGRDSSSPYFYDGGYKLDVLGSSTTGALRVNGNSVITGSLGVSGSVNFKSLTSQSQQNVLTYNNSTGEVSYITASVFGAGAGITSAGAQYDIQYNNGASGFAADSNFTYNGDTVAISGSNKLKIHDTVMGAVKITGLVYTTTQTVLNIIPEAINNGFRYCLVQYYIEMTDGGDPATIYSSRSGKLTLNIPHNYATTAYRFPLIDESTEYYGGGTSGEITTELVKFRAYWDGSTYVKIDIINDDPTYYTNLYTQYTLI